LHGVFVFLRVAQRRIAQVTLLFSGGLHAFDLIQSGAKTGLFTGEAGFATDTSMTIVVEHGQLVIRPAE
jgi:hypothetical protein